MGIEQEKEDKLLESRLRDLAERSYKQSVYTFSSFLGLSEQDLFHRMERSVLHASPQLFGGYEGAERVMLRFGNEADFGYVQDFPICCVHIRPLSDKFGENLSHRDFLGALMNLGIERDTLGDIRTGEKDAYLFCQETVVELICEELRQVRHTTVVCERVETLAEVPEEEPEELVIQVASERIDAVIAKTYHMSREEALNQFRQGKVFLNGRNMESNSKAVLAGDVVNVRGFGKFRVIGEPTITKKGKLSLKIAVFR